MTKEETPTTMSDKTSSPEETALDLSEPSSKPTRSVSGIRWALVVSSVLSSTFLFSLDNSIVADIQPMIIDTFGHIDKLPWLSVAFALGTAATTLIWASAYGTFDGKINYLLSLFLFEVGSALCGAANTMDVLIFGRALAGLGGAGLYVGVLTLLSALTTAAERPLYVASIGILWGLGSVLGPIIGGAFAESPATWRWSFYINLVVAAVFAPVYTFMIPSVNPQPDRTWIDKLSKMDFVGSVLIMTGFCCSVTALSFGGSQYPWKSATIIVLLVIGALAFVAFWVQQIWCLGTTVETRLFPVQYFKNRTLTLMFALSCMGAPPVIIPVYFISIFFQFAKGDSALNAAVKLLPFLCMAVLFVLLNGAVMGKDGRYAPWFIGASPIILAGATLMFTIKESTSNSAIYGYTALLGIGAGCLIQICFVVSQAVVPRSEMPLSVAFINLGQMTGLVVGITIANTLFLNLSQKYIGEVLPEADPDTIKGAISGAGSVFLKSLDEETRREVIHAIISAISKVYAFIMTTSAIEFILSLFLKWERVFLTM